MLWFRTAEKAQSVFQNIQMVLAGNIDTDSLTERDEFGVIFTASKGSVSHAILNDMNKQGELFKLLSSLGYVQGKN